MGIKIKKAIGSKKKTTSTIKITDDLSLNKKEKKKLLNELGEYLVDITLESVSGLKSPIKGEGWKKSLSKEYKDKKKSEGGSSVADMELSGKTLDKLKFKPKVKNLELDLGIFDPSRAWIADGHNKLSGKTNNTPKRRFLPAKGQKYKSSIDKEIQAIIDDAAFNSANIKKKDLKDINSKESLMGFIEGATGLTKAGAKGAALRNESFVEAINAVGKLELLK